MGETETGTLVPPTGGIRASAKLSIERKPGELLTPLKSIRSNCLGCCCGSAKEVALCTVTYCPAWPYRFGKRTRARKIVAEERTLGQVKDKWWAEHLNGYTQQGYYRTEQAARERERGA